MAKKTNKKPLIIAGISAGVAALALGLGKAFKSMKASAKAQHEVDKAAHCLPYGKGNALRA